MKQSTERNPSPIEPEPAITPTQQPDPGQMQVPLSAIIEQLQQMLSNSMLDIAALRAANTQLMAENTALRG